MAQWVERVRADGGLSVQIKWRLDGRWQSETFTNLRLAAEFRTAVEVAGHEWPQDWVRGEGWVAPTPPPVRVTFAEVAMSEGGYFEQQARRVKRGKLKPYTLHRDRRTYALHFEELFGHVPFEEVGCDEIGDWVDDQVEAGSAAKTIRNRHGLLSSVMKHGRIRMSLRVDNPCELTELPDLDTATCEARQIRFFQQSEWALLRACLAPDIQLALDVDLATGLRWGELSALRAGDVTFSGEGGRRQATLHIVRAWSRRAPDDPAAVRSAEAETPTWVLGPPKSKRPRWVAARSRLICAGWLPA
jgi:integrase